MKVFTPEISWHQKEPIFSVDFCNSTWKLASAGADFTIKIWQLKEDLDGNIGLDFLANLDRHSKPVNCVRFSPDGKYLASAGDDCIIIIWKLSEDEDDYMASEPSFGSEEIVSKEKWTVHKMLRRGHLEDIYDLAWSPDGTQIISGSVDNSAIIWDVNKGCFTNIIKDHKHYVQGVCWDPRGQYVVTHSSDRSCKVYSLSKNKCVHTIQKSSFPIPNPTEDGPKHKSTKLFMDETMQSFFRRCRFSPDGLLLALPGGIYETGEKHIKATYVYTRGGFSKPALCLPGSKKASIGVCFCPVTFENMSKDCNENKAEFESMFRLPYRMCYAVATLDAVLFYDTQHQYPFGFVSNVHYASLTDMTWSSDGRIVVVSSLDGYCSIISFEDGELGKPSKIDPMEYVTNKIKAKREARKEAMKVENESKQSISTQNDKEKEQSGTGRPNQAPAKDQPTLHKFVTPIRKRKRNIETSASPQTPSAKAPSVKSPSARTPSVKSPSAKPPSNQSPSNHSPMLIGRGSPDSPVDLTTSPVKHSIKSPNSTDHDMNNQPSSESKIATRTPKRANLISLGFKPIAKPSGNIASGSEDGKIEKETEPLMEASTDPQSSLQSQPGKPRRINFMTVSKPATSECQTVPSDIKSNGTESDSKDDEKVIQCLPNSICSATSQPLKAPRRIALIPVSAKRDHSGVIKEITNSRSVDIEKNTEHQETGTDPAKTDAKVNTCHLQPSLESKKLARRVEVISLLDCSPEKRPGCADSSSGQLGAKGKCNADELTGESKANDENNSGKAPNELPRKEVCHDVCGMTSTCQEESPKSQPSSKEDLNTKIKSQNDSSPGSKAPRRVSFVTLPCAKSTKGLDN